MHRLLLILGAMAVQLGAVLAAVVALLTYTVGCTENCGRTWMHLAQLVVAVVGLLPATLMLIAAVHERWRRAGAFLAVTVTNYAAWAILNDAAVHGWNGLTLI